jgi:N-acetylneuraminic acid mutarotase
MYIFGGRFDQIGPQQTQENIYDNRLYVFDPHDNSWSLVPVQGQIPSGRRSHSACMFYFKIKNLFFFI